MPTRTEAVKTFLSASTHADLANLYNYNMEVQVNVAQDGGERIENTFAGRPWHGWSDGITTWKSFRIPYKANTEPEYEDSEIRFDLAEHSEAVGMTGWDWVAKKSKWVAFDFDAITGHSDKHGSKLSKDELEEIKNTALEIEWVTIRRSTSGKGLHLYVHLHDIPTQNHNEHAALARSILGKLSALTGFDFKSKVDICGGVMWCWARRMETNTGLTLVKQGVYLTDIPPNWKDHINVVSGKRRKNLPQSIENDGIESEFEELAGQRPTVILDDSHKALISFLKDNNCLWWWDQDHHMLITHTVHLKEAHKQLQLKGFFDTQSEGRERGIDHNCFLFPLRNGAWSIRRYTLGVQEHASWDQDGAGWTRCYFNKEPDIPTAAKSYGAIEDPKGGFVFTEAEVAQKAAQLLGVDFNVPTAHLGRKAKLKEHRDGRLNVEINRENTDNAGDWPGWLPESKVWTRLFNRQLISPIEPEVGNYDDLLRHLVTISNEDYGWMIRSDNKWRSEPLTHIKLALAAQGHNVKEVSNILGSAIFKAWTLVNKAFQPEYPGDRQWNLNAAQLQYLPTQDSENLSYPTWIKVLEHCGTGLDKAVAENSWTRANGIINGADYLKCWIASVFKEPLEPLPYLFFYGPQNSGKSIFHEALSLLLTKGYVRADAALISQAGFNGELEGAIICVVEETDLRVNNAAQNRIKDWVTARDLPIRAMYKQLYHTPNSTHWIHCSNDHKSCPIFPGDTRIVISYVETLSPIDLIPKKKLLEQLEKEAPDFLKSVLNLDLPVSNDRLNIPVISTSDKAIVEQLNQTSLETFLSERCKFIAGAVIKFSDFHDAYTQSLDTHDRLNWGKKRVARDLPPLYPKGRLRKDNHVYIGNICWVNIDIKPETKLILSEDHLIPEI